MNRSFYVYILASRYRGTMYVGVSNDLGRRLEAHKSGIVPGFTKQYKVTSSSTPRNTYPSWKPARANAS